jgi:hypothetical protein
MTPQEARHVSSGTAIRQEIELTRRQFACALAKRAKVSACPKIASVASMGGETVPPHIASRIGCAILPSETTFDGREAR